MQRFITDERTGIRYELIGDYYYSCLTVEKSPPHSKYGRLRQRYLREHKRMMRWVGLMNNIRAYVDEIILNDSVYSDKSEFTSI